jgi:hypothetical protein
MARRESRDHSAAPLRRRCSDELATRHSRYPIRARKMQSCFQANRSTRSDAFRRDQRHRDIAVPVREAGSPRHQKWLLSREFRAPARPFVRSRTLASYGSVRCVRLLSTQVGACIHVRDVGFVSPASTGRYLTTGVESRTPIESGPAAGITSLLPPAVSGHHRFAAGHGQVAIHA